MHLFLDEYLYIATDTLVKYYKSEETVLLEYDWPTCCVKHYTPLSIFCYKEKYTKSEATAVARMLTSTGIMTHEHHGNVYGKVTESFNDLFAPFEKFACSPYVILIEGAAGIGKSTLCKEIALQWANKKVLKNRSVLFLLFMHDPKIKNLTNVELLVKHFIQNEILANKITDWLVATDGKYLTIIIDGYDEDCGNSFITHGIIGHKTLTQCGLVITSRSAALLHISEIVNQRALMLGFSKNNHITFIDTALKSSRSMINHFKDYLHSNPLIDNLCNIPLIMTMLLWFVVNNEEMNNITIASLIQKYIMTITKKKIIPSLKDLHHHPYDQMIKDLSQFVFSTIQKDQLTFTVDEMMELCEKHFRVYWHGPDFLSRMFKVGLLSTIYFQEENVNREIFYFCYMKIQEYLAAYYISLLPDGELLKLLHGTFWNICYLNVWMFYVDISGGKSFVFKRFLSGGQAFETSGMSVKTISNKCLKEAGGDHVNKLLGLNIDLRHHRLSHDHLQTLTMLLLRSTNKQWKNLNLANCDIDCQGCMVLCKMLCPSTTIKFEMVDISFNNFQWESFYTFCSVLKNWHTKKLTISVDTLYDTVTMKEINSFKDLLKENFQSDIFSDEILLLIYLAKQNVLIAVYVEPTCIRWFHWNDCKLNGDMIKHVKTFIENKMAKIKIAFSYNIIDHPSNIKKISTLLSDIKNIQLCGSYLHSKGAYLLNIASIVNYQYNPQELIADYLAAVLSHNLQSTTPYLESLSATYATVVKNSLQCALSMRVFDISNNSIDSQMATEIATMLSFTSNIMEFIACDNNLSAESIIRIAKALQNVSTLTIFHIACKSVGEKAADDIATVLSNNTQLQVVNLNSNSFKTVGMIKIAKALQNISTLKAFRIDSNNVGEEAADDIATVLSNNTQLQVVNLNSNSFKTVGMIKIAKALQNISTLTEFSIYNNNVGKEAADDIATVLSNNTQLQVVNLNSNSFKTVGMIKIAKALQNISTLTAFRIDSNNVGEEAADDIATVLSNNTQLQVVNLNSNSFKTVGMIKIAKALQNISTLTEFGIYNNNVGEEAADDIATVLSNNTQLQVVNLNSNSFKTVGMIKIAKALQNISTLTAFRIDSNNVGEEAADDIATVLSNNTQLQMVNLDNNSFKTVGMIKIAKALQNISTLTAFRIDSNNVGEEAADDIATVLSNNTQLQMVDLDNNSFKTVGMIKIEKALQNISTLPAFRIDSNNVGEEAADDIATVLSNNTQLQMVDLGDNSFKTVGMIKIAKPLQNISTLTEFGIYNNNVGEEVADDIATVLSNNTQLQMVDLGDNSFKTVGMIKIAKALQNISTLTAFRIDSNNVGEEAADDIATVLSNNTQLQMVHLNSNSFKTVGMIKIAKALQNISTLTEFSIDSNNVDEDAADDIATASSPTLLLLPNAVKVEIFCKAFAIFIMPTVLKLLLTTTCSWVLLDKTVAISSAASSPTLLL